jgi:thiomorpholine-carboxylate dehydrogenase
MTIYLDDDAVRDLLDMAKLIPAMRAALISFSAGRVQQPVRQTLRQHGGFFAIMPAVGDSMGCKLVTFYRDNGKRGLPTHMAIVALFDPQTGKPLAVMDGSRITEMRTAAVSAVATEIMAAPDAKVLAILGSGAQARSHVEALRLVRDLEEIRVWSRTPSHAEAFAAEVGARVTSAEDAVRGADIVVTATSADTPVLRGSWLRSGAHVNAVGAPRPEWRELDDAVMRNVVVVDSRAGALLESGDIIASGAKIHAELGEILAEVKPARREETTVFKSLGMAIEDVVAARLVYDGATE